jgi:uncharacterized protein (TIGR02246 family)
MRLFRKPFVAALLLGVLVPFSHNFGQSVQNRDLLEFTRLEHVWNEAQLRNDADALASLWADDIEVIVPRMPVMTKTEAVNMARSGHIKFSRYETSNLRVRVYGDAAVVAGRMERTRSMDGREIADNWWFAKTYIRQSDGKWRVVSFQASDAPNQE